VPFDPSPFLPLNTGLLSSPTRDYNPLGSSSSYGPTNSGSFLQGLGNLALSTASSAFRIFKPITSGLISSGLGAAVLSSFGPVSYKPGKQYSAGSVSNSGKTFILNQPLTNAQGKPQTRIPISGGTIDLKAFSSGEVPIAITGNNSFDQAQAAEAYYAKYGVRPELGTKAGQLFHHVPQTGTAIVSGVELPISRMQHVPAPVNKAIPHEGPAALPRRSTAAQGVSGTDVRMAATQYNAGVRSSFAARGSAKAFAGLNVYLMTRDVLQAGGALQSNYEPTSYGIYVFEDGGGSYTVQPGGWLSSATKSYVSGQQAGQVIKINSGAVDSHRSTAEQSAPVNDAVFVSYSSNGLLATGHSRPS
jgi:hypothetical protein